MKTSDYPGRDRMFLDRVERIQTFNSTCYECIGSLATGDVCPSSPYYSNRIYGKMKWWDHLDDSRLGNLLRRTRILILTKWTPELAPFLEQMPNLKALSVPLYAGGSNDFDPGESLEIPSQLLLYNSQLTHLSVYLDGWNQFFIYFASGTYYFQTICYLKILFATLQIGSTVHNLHPELGIKAVVPQLESLNLEGPISSSDEDLKLFIRFCGQGVLEFVNLCYTAAGRQEDIGMSCIAQFPHMTLYGTSLNTVATSHGIQLEGTQTSQRRHQPFTLLLYGFDPFTFDPENLVLRMKACILKWDSTEIVISRTWASLKEVALAEDRTSKSEWLEIFFEMLMKENIRFLDKDGVEVSDSRCEKFWQTRHE
ncbi:hypothetical protein CPB86DRAFT_796432 [Serendipita vermifera]|nr:hypothetical protein CPB86DRAFT_796432 [Serendipita vermifera]